MRTIKCIYTAHYSPIADLITYSPLPNRSIQHIDPFLFLNHHGPQKYTPHNNGLPFGPHPHRGMETVTFILEGDIMHKDSAGHQSVIKGGGIQWMTAGKGLIHAEVSSEEFKENGGDMEILQLWLNLPSKLKLTEPRYIGLQKDEIPTVSLDGGKASLDLISGKWENTNGAVESLTNIFLSTIYLDPLAKIDLKVPKDHNIFFYIIRGKLTVNDKKAEMLQLVEFDNDDENLTIEAETECIILFGHAKPFNQPVVAQGPFVMNTEQEIQDAYNDYRAGKFGVWKE